MRICKDSFNVDVISRSGGAVSAAPSGLKTTKTTTIAAAHAATLLATAARFCRKVKLAGTAWMTPAPYGHPTNKKIKSEE